MVYELDIAVVGGGFGGIYCAKQLLKQKSTKDLRIGVIARENHMVFQPMLPEVAGSSLSPRHVVNPIRRLCRGASVIKGEVTYIDHKKKEIHLDAGDFTHDVIIKYKELVLTVGAQTDLSRVPGMTEHALLLQNAGDAMKLRSTVINRIEEANVADEKLRCRLLTFVVVGGGYSGVETAGQMIDLLNGIHKYYLNVDREHIRVILVHSRDRVLPGLDKKLADYTVKVLRKQGVEVLLEERVRSITAHRVYLQSGTEIESATVISTIGNAPHPVVTRLCREEELETVQGRVVTDHYCRVKEREHLWAAGDCARVPMQNGEGEYCPDTAQFAMRQGSLLAKNIGAQRSGRELKPFTFSGLGELATVGHQKAVANVMGFTFSGFIAWWMWRTIYLAKLPGIERKLRVVLEWTFELFFPRDINLLSPRYSRNLDQMRLEKGDVLFHSGEPAFSFYIVKSGRMDIYDNDGSLVKAITAGQHFGERALLTDQIWRFNARAAEPTELVNISRDVFMQMVEASGSFSRMLKRTAITYQSNEEIEALLSQMPESMMTQKVSEIMSRDVISVKISDTVASAINLLRAHPHSHYPVVDNENKPVGFLERNDFYQGLKTHSDLSSTLSDFDLEPPAIISINTEIPAVVERLVRSGTTKLVIADEAGKLAGMVTIRDIINPIEAAHQEQALAATAAA